MPITEIAVHDTRLDGAIYPRPHVALIETSGGETLEQLGRRIAAAVRTAGGSVQHLRIYAHGARPSGASGPGEGRLVVIASDYLHRDNANAFGQALAGLIRERIWLYVCAAAAQPDGEALCLALAQGAGVPVVASRNVQDYATGGTVPTFAGYEIPGIPTPQWINFEQWEGEVVICNPDGRVSPWFTGPAPVSGRDRSI
jgi:hypothetical protein